MENELTMCLEE